MPHESPVVRSAFLKTVCERGYYNQCTDLGALDGALMTGVVSAYIGFDCTADSLHVGSLMQIMLLRWLQKTGHKPVVLIGGGTSKVGDPSFKDESRLLLDDDQIAANMAGIKKVFAKYLRFGDGPSDALMVNNADWLDSLNYLGFLRDVGRHFTINRMLSFDSIKLRLNRQQPLTFLEFNYMILQGYDFMELNRRHGVSVQMGGSDQWGNIVNGVELARRMSKTEVFGLTSPLLTTASGAKMGKTETGAVWLNEERLAPYDFWQYWRNTDDADVGKFFRLFTELPEGEIRRLEALEGSAINDSKKVLADEVTTLCHGKDAAQTARVTAEKTFEQGRLGAGLPTINATWEELKVGLRVLDLLVKTPFVASKGEARRLMRGGGICVNGASVADEAAIVGISDMVDGAVKLSVGKKRHALVKAD